MVIFSGVVPKRSASFSFASTRSLVDARIFAFSRRSRKNTLERSGPAPTPTMLHARMT